MRVAREKRLHPRVAFCAFCLMEWGVISKGSEDGKGRSEGSANEARDARRAASGLEGPAGGMPDGAPTDAANKGATATRDRRGDALRKARKEAKGGGECGKKGENDGERGRLRRFGRPPSGQRAGERPRADAKERRRGGSAREENGPARRKAATGPKTNRRAKGATEGGARTSGKPPCPTLSAPPSRAPSWSRPRVCRARTPSRRPSPRRPALCRGSRSWGRASTARARW